jgi:hypothetical protein
MLLDRFLVPAYSFLRYHAEAVGAACADVVSFCEILDRESTEAGSVRLALPRRWTCSWELMSATTLFSAASKEALQMEHLKQIPPSLIPLFQSPLWTAVKVPLLAGDSDVTLASGQSYL